MKYCPNCSANVEGLINHCDCCGAPLDTRIHFFKWGTVEFAFDFGDCVNKIMSEIESIDTSEYHEFLSQISFLFYCFPKSTAENGNIKNRVYYSASRKFAGITILVDYGEYVYDNQNHKTYRPFKERIELVAISISRGIHSLQARLREKNLNIDDLTISIDQILEKYTTDI